jgi:hypothetical protein
MLWAAGSVAALGDQARLKSDLVMMYSPSRTFGGEFTNVFRGFVDNIDIYFRDLHYSELVYLFTNPTARLPNDFCDGDNIAACCDMDNGGCNEFKDRCITILWCPG